MNQYHTAITPLPLPFGRIKVPLVNTVAPNQNFQASNRKPFLATAEFLPRDAEGLDEHPGGPRVQGQEVPGAGDGGGVLEESDLHAGLGELPVEDLVVVHLADGVVDYRDEEVDEDEDRRHLVDQQEKGGDVLSNVVPLAVHWNGKF